MLGGFHDFGLAVAVGVLLAVSGCGEAGSHGSPNSAAKVKQVKVGMSVKQVDQILSKPIRVLDVGQIKEYEGYTDQEGYHDIFVHFDNDAVTRVNYGVHKKSRW